MLAVALGSASNLWAQNSQASAKRPPVGSFAEMLDLDSVAHLKPWVTKRASSGLIDSNFDYGNFVREEPGRRFVMMDVKGRGAIDRFLAHYCKGDPKNINYDFLVYLDGQQQPTIKVDLNDLFNGKHEPFVEPLTGRCGFGKENNHLLSSYSLAPIGFEKSCKVVVVQRDPEEQYQWRTNDPSKRRTLFFYQIAYRLCEPDVRVKKFTWKLDANEKAALEKVKKLWAGAGASPWPKLQATDDQTASKTVSVTASQRVSLLELQSPGTMREMFIQVKPENDTVAARKKLIESLWIEMTWDDADKPQVRAPLSVFFLAPDNKIDMNGFWMGCKDRRYYCYLPMPFFKNAKIAVRTTESIPPATTIIAKFRWTPSAPQAGNALFHAHRYDYASTPDGTKHVMALETSGRGHVMGVSSDHRAHCEDDDCWRFDGDPTPWMQGTGTEESFNFGWGLGDLQVLPMHGMRVPFGDPAKWGYRNDSETFAYRFHTTAAYPFKKSIKFSWVRERPQGRSKQYAGVVYYYKK